MCVLYTHIYDLYDSAIWDSMDEIRGHYVKWNKPNRGESKMAAE